MFSRSEWYQTLRDQLRESTNTTVDGKTLAALFQVELGLYLLSSLNLQDDPVTVLPAVLSGIPFPAIGRLNQAQQQQIAIARILLSAYSAETGWETALTRYALLPEDLRTFSIQTDIPLNEQLVEGCQIPAYQNGARHKVYEQTLSTLPPWANNRREFAPEGEVTFSIYTYSKSGRHERSVSLTSNQVAAAGTLPLLPFRPARPPLVISYNDLEQVAQYMDKRLAERQLRTGWNTRLQKYVHFHAYTDGELTREPNIIPLHIQGFTHLVGMVGSGKSTLMKLIAAYCALQDKPMKVAIVLGDVVSVLDTVDELNHALGADPEHPIAIPLIGRSNRHEHLKRLYAREGLPSESGERALNTACPLFALLSDDQLTTLPGIPEPGREPCEQLIHADTEKKHLCPLFSQCPSQQVWHDLPQASIIVTTSGAMAKSSVPTQVDRRRLKYGDYLYTHCDLVMFDECDTVMEWFDNEFATLLDLWGKPNALFNRADPAASTALTSGVNRNEARWVRSERRSAEAIENLIDHLSGAEGSQSLRRWIGERYFTAFHLFQRIAMRLIGLWDFTPEAQIPTDKAQQLEEIMSWFGRLLVGDPLTLRRRQEPVEAINELIDMLRQIADGGSAAILADCQDWITEHIRTIDDNLIELNNHLQDKNNKLPLENIETVAQKLALALNVALLDRNLRPVFYEWYNQPDNVDDEIGGQPFRPASATLSDVLPIPPMGRIFGTYYVQADDSSGHRGLLSRFEYSNIGRMYLLRYHNLLADLGICGPNVLAMSGTSWLEGSSQWHISHTPVGVLQAPVEERDLIRDASTFAFIPQRDKEGKPIKVSGEDNILEAVNLLGMTLAKSGHLDRELSDLADLGSKQPGVWGDRERLLLLVNSYPQAKAVAHQVMAHMKNRVNVFYLTRPEQDDDELYGGLCQAMQRGDAERFAFTEGKILVAPIGSIGRAYNILNRDVDSPRAAFGSVYFMIRPMPHPYDVQGLASELNAYTMAACANAKYPAWTQVRLYDQASTFRRDARNYWQHAEMRYGYSSMTASERRDLAATTFGRIVQAAGRLVRGGVPFHCYFVDANWAPKSADAAPNTPRQTSLDSSKDSLLTEIIKLLEDYEDSIFGKSLYEPFSGLLDIANFYPNRKGK